MKLLSLMLVLVVWGFSCNSPSSQSDAGKSATTNSVKAEAPVDDGKGIGEIKNVKLNDPLDEAMAEKGKGIYEMKCAACHKLSAQRVVGPGWEGITQRRKPEWIMNMTLNVEVMLEKDPAAREMLKECLVKMPNQNLSVADARSVLEFMYVNDMAAK